MIVPVCLWENGNENENENGNGRRVDVHGVYDAAVVGRCVTENGNVGLDGKAKTGGIGGIDGIDGGGIDGGGIDETGGVDEIDGNFGNFGNFENGWCEIAEKQESGEDVEKIVVGEREVVKILVYLYVYWNGYQNCGNGLFE